MSTTRLPELPNPIRDKHGVPLFGSTQMHAYGLAVWKAAMDFAATTCDEWAAVRAPEYGGLALRNCAEKLRSLPLPEQGGPQ